MSTQATSPNRLRVVLVSPGVGTKECFLSPGSTVGDLLRAVRVSTTNLDPMIGERQVDESEVLDPGAVVYLIPRVTSALEEITNDLLPATHLSKEELRTEIAAHFYQQGKLTLGQASRLAGLSQLQFFHQLASRQIPINYDVADLEEDLKTLRELGRP